MPRPSPLLCVAVVTALATPAGAADLSGKWRHVRHSAKYDVKAWGGSCGAPPRDYARRPNKVWEATQSGGKLTLKRRRQRIGTHDCLSENPGIKLRSYDAGSKTTVCSTEPSSPHPEKGRYVLKASLNRLRWTGKTEYDWSLSGTRCQASMRETWVFERVDPVPEPPPPVAAAEAPPPEPVAAEPAAPVAAREPTGRPGRPRVRPQQQEGEGGIILQLGGAEGAGGAEGLGGLADERHQVGVASSRRLTTVAIAIVLATVAIALFAGAFLLVSRRRRRPRGRGGSARGGAAPSAGGGTSSDHSDTGASRMSCPRCGRGFDPLEQYCPYDASPLRTSAGDDSEPDLPPGEEGEELSGKICPACAARYTGDKTYCGRDGSELVLLN